MANITVASDIGVERSDTSSRPGFLRRLLAAVQDAQQRKADREVAEILARYADTPAYELEAERAFSLRIHPFGQVK